MTRRAADPALARWLDLLNDVSHPERAHAACAPDVLVHAYTAGRGGRLEVFRGIEGVIEWVRRAPPERYTFVLLSEHPAAPHPDLPPGDRALAARYRVENSIDTFTNEGDWLIHARGEQVVALRHEPEPLREPLSQPVLREGVDLNDLARRFEQEQRQEHEHAHQHEPGHEPEP